VAFEIRKTRNIAAASRPALDKSTAGGIAREGRMTVTIGRRELLAALGGAAAWPLAALAQPVSHMPRVGVLLAEADNQDMQARLEGLRQGLEHLGWYIRVVYRFGEGKPDRFQPLAKDLVAMRPDLIVAQTPPVVVAVLKETSVVPIVFVDVSDPIGAGFIANLARPGAISPAW
jgi:putative tryptophan/tyrosine transport system substrate-binding protein